MTLLRKWKLKRYLLTYTMKSMPIVYILLLGIVAILFYPISFAENSTAWIGGYILAPILCFFVVKHIMKDVKVLKQQWVDLQQQDKLEQMLDDYSESEKYVDGNLMVGERYLFGKGAIRVVSYDAICKIHIVNAERKGKLARDLRYEDADGQEHFVCQLDPLGNSHTELDRIYRIVLKKNPNAETGL